MRPAYGPGDLKWMPICPPRTIPACLGCGESFQSRAGTAKWCDACRGTPEYKTWRRRSQNDYARRARIREKEKANAAK